MFETSARLLRLLGLLQSRRDWTGNQLAERLGVSARTVRTDVERLRTLGYAVDAVPGVGGGYRLGVGAAVPPLLLDDDEAVAVAVGLRGAAAGAIEGIEETSIRALAKLEQLLPARLRRRVASLTAATVTVPPSAAPAPSVDPETLMAIANACRDHERLRFDYASLDGTESRRVVEPHRIVSSGRRWYLLAHDVDRGEWRTFRVDRLRLRLPAGPRFVPRDLSDSEVRERVAGQLASATWAYRARVTVFAPAEAVAARLPWPATIKPLDESSCRLEVGSDSPELLAVHLGMLGADFTVDPAESPELTEWLRVLAGRYARAGHLGSAP